MGSFSLTQAPKVFEPKRERWRASTLPEGFTGSPVRGLSSSSVGLSTTATLPTNFWVRKGEASQVSYTPSSLQGLAGLGSKSNCTFTAGSSTFVVVCAATAKGKAKAAKGRIDFNVMVLGFAD